MPCDISQLDRGAVCLALHPYTAGFPLDRVLRDVENDLLAQLERHESVESIAATIRSDAKPPEIVATVKLRRVVVLQDGTNAGRQDITVARINSITQARRDRGGNWYRKLQNGIHPLHLLVGDDPDHGITAGMEAYVDVTSVMTIRKASILRRTGTLNGDEMREISERLVRGLEIDLSGYLAKLPPQPPQPIETLVTPPETSPT